MQHHQYALFPLEVRKEQGGSGDGSGPGLGNIPRHPLSHHCLHMHEVGEYTQYGCSCGSHDYQPEIELSFGPVIFAPAFNDADYFCCHVGREGFVRSKGRRMREVGRKVRR